MELKYINKEFRSIDKILLEGSDIEDQILLYGSDNSFPGLEDFIEYGFKFWINKYGYGSWSPLDLLPLDRKEEIGTRLEDIQKIGDTLFPTLTDKISKGPKYFGTISTGKQKILIFEVNPGYSKAKLFDTDDCKIEINEMDPRWYKLIWLVITSENKDEISNISLSFITWSNSKNAHRNINKYLLRNDEIPVYPETVTKIDNSSIWVDSCSFTILGTENISVEAPDNKDLFYNIYHVKNPTNTVLLDFIIDKYKNSDKWSPNITYSKGQQVSFKRISGSSKMETWVSVCNINKGNRPDLSSKWMNTSLLNDNFHSVRVNVKLNGQGIVTPSTFTMPSKNENINIPIQVTFTPGEIIKKYYIGNRSYPGGNEEFKVDTETWESYENKTYTKQLIINSKDIVGSNLITVELGKPKIRVGYRRVNQDLVPISEDETYKGNIDLLQGTPINIDNVKFDFGNYNLIGVNKNYLIDGIIQKVVKVEDFGITTATDGSESIWFNDNIDVPCTCIYYDIVLKELVRKVTIVDYIGFFVDKRSQEIKAIGEANVDSSIRFYPTDGNMNIAVNFDLYYNGETYNGSLTTSSNNRDGTFSLGSSYLITRGKSYFELKLFNLKADCDIKLWK